MENEPSNNEAWSCTSALSSGLGTTAIVGDRVAVLHRGIPTGRYGTVIAARAGCLEVRGDGDSDDRFPMWDSADCFVVVPNAGGNATERSEGRVDHNVGRQLTGK